MSDMLGISSGAIGAYQRALTTVSNNIANVNTEGYSRQDVVLQDSAPKKLAGMYIGTGVMLQTVKRQFDAFAESNLRNSTSDLSSQKPMVDYAKRVMDIMGDKSIGLSSAFDNFFAAASALSADPASTVQRTSFMRTADGVASRFGELNTQLDLISTETRQGLESAATQVNTLTSQLALINQSLTKSPTLAGQPPELLDRRDLTLRQLSDLARIKTSFAPNGAVSVSMGATMTQGLVVDGNKARPIGLNSTVKDKVELILDPYGKTESLASASGGQIGGYQSFISQVLEPAQKNLSALAQTFATETNSIQKNGIDGYGQMGQDLFAFDPAASSPAAGLRLAMNDGMRVATASQFRVSEGNTNITTTRATVKFTGTTPTTPLSNSNLVNNGNATAGVTFKVDGAQAYAPVTTLSGGVGATFYLDDAAAGQQLQVMTRDGRQLLGQTLNENEKFQLFKPANGFADNATYSDQYLNKTGPNAYRNLDLFYGAKAKVLFGQNFDQYGAAGAPIPMPAVMETSRIPGNGDYIPDGALSLNGVKLGELKALAIPADVAAWINDKTPDTNIRAEVFSEIRVPTGQIDLKKGLTINGEVIQGYHDLKGLVDAINSSLNPDQTSSLDVSKRVEASLTSSGELVLRNSNGQPIQINANVGTLEPAANALNMQLGTYNAQVRMTQIVRDLHVPSGNLQFAKSLEINGVNLSQASYSLGADTSYKVSFGYPQQDFTGTPSELMAAMSDRTKASMSGIDFGTVSPADAFKSFNIEINGAKVNLDNIHPATGDLAGMATELEARLNEADAGRNALHVNVSGNQLVFTDDLGRNLTNLSLTTSESAALAGTKTGQMDQRFGDEYHAEFNNGELVIKAYDAKMSDADIANKFSIKLGNLTVDAKAGMSSMDDLIARINSHQADTGVTAGYDSNLDLKLTVTDEKGVKTISIGPGKNADGTFTSNALGLEPMDYSATERLKRMLADDPTKTDIRMSFSTYTYGDPKHEQFGSPADLAKIGLRTGAYIEGGSPDDLLLFVTGKGSAKVATTFSGEPANARDTLRSQTLTVKFTAADRYSIFDAKTGTELASRQYDPTSLEPVIEFQGLNIKLTHAASVGDSFSIDGNFDGLANNVNMLDMVDLNKKPVTNGKTIANTYIDQINNVGNLAQQAIITQQALTVVNDQAVAARDKVSGVNLDDEAAALIRYQQAYQACAKALQVSGELFDTIAQIR
ncbi:flagellar hook-associated protein FlgK [Limnohabitans sp. Jir61]|uniref:flagellar hook-associated protein FlgK n=1 Tax=Limnohabitans sp. Jir61 TaxID=1826168 RepID=UPI000D3698AF|nr:flagellar hook-associated protein FlgK [Limnohabitans sp. Jir61]PUE31013.1 flagellar hook-associated protein FlgK [Limnohabitans sp. Jir61]